MAESIVSDIAIDLISKLGSFALKEIGVCWGLRDELDKLKRTVATIEAVLLHAEEQSIHNPQLKHWLGMLSEALYDADDLLDEFSTEALREQAMGGSQVSKKVRLFFSRSNQFAFGLKMGHKVKALRERLDEIAAEKNKFHLEERSVVERHFVSNGRDQTHSHPPEVVIGREQEKGEIVRLLLSSDCSENVSVVSIVGIGGLGKTTLAQMIYNDDMVKNHFELKIWVCVSDDFDVKLLVKKVIESVTRKAPEPDQMDPLKYLLHEKINGRKYLLVLDDVWNQDLQKWYSFKDLLAGGARGSKIVITTRLRTVAEMSRSICIHELRGLPDNDAWLLFKHMAFSQYQLPNPGLEALGKEIVTKCCGVPLAIKTIAGMLYFKNLESEWLLFRDKELSSIDVYKNGILPILKLSYDHLPSHYKHCFAYCSLYPKDYKIPVDELIQLWKAQGYLKSNNADVSLRDVGIEYFKNLVQLSFFQDVEKDDFDDFKCCKIHDLMHDLAISVAGDNVFASHSGNGSIQNKTQHMSFRVDQNSLSQYMSSLIKAKKIRTVLPLDTESGIQIKEEEVGDVFCNLKCLRVLNLSKMGVNALPNSIHKLKHLRFLDLSYNADIKKLPNSVTHLHNLQVLKLEWCENLKKLPSGITKLVNLTDVNNYCCEKLSYMPRGIGKLTRIETLSEFVIAEDESMRKHGGGVDELRSLNKLIGNLTISNLRYVKNAEAANLSAKKQLEGLTLNWVRCSDPSYIELGRVNDVADDEMRLEGLCPHPNLKALDVWHYRGVKPPSWLPSLTHLVFVYFLDCTTMQWLPPLDHLPHLKDLRICNLTALGRIDVENGRGSLAFPSLSYLQLTDCPRLRGFERQSTEELPCFPSVSFLRTTGCPNLTYLPLFPKLETLDSDGLKSLMEIMANSASESTSSPFYILSQLRFLTISNVEDSPENDLLQYAQAITSLQDLVFDKCSFRNVCGDETDDGMQWQSLKNLRSVAFYNMENSVGLPSGLQYVTNLQRLDIECCPSLVCVPEWMPKLVALQHLSIGRSPQLVERCKTNTSEDWPRISHIPNIEIDGKPVQRSGCYLL